MAAILLEQGASMAATTKKGFTALHLAAKYGNFKVAKLLLHKQAPVDAEGKHGVTPLHVATHYDHQKVALLLLDKGASPHATPKNGYTPLHISAKKDQMEIAKTLIDYGAKVLTAEIFSKTDWKKICCCVFVRFLANRTRTVDGKLSSLEDPMTVTIFQTLYIFWLRPVH